MYAPAATSATASVASAMRSPADEGGSTGSISPMRPPEPDRLLCASLVLTQVSFGRHAGGGTAQAGRVAPLGPRHTRVWVGRRPDAGRAGFGRGAGAVHAQRNAAAVRQ